MTNYLANPLAEQSVIGAVLNGAYDRVASLVSAEDFTAMGHRFTYEAVVQLTEEGALTDAVAVADWLESQGKLNAVGGLPGLVQAQTEGLTANAESYAKQVRAMAQKRALVALGSRMQKLKAADQTDDVIADVLAEIDRLSQLSESSCKPLPIKSHLLTAMELIDKRFNAANDSFGGLPTGFDRLDEITSGLQAGDLIVLAGRPSMGKTSLAMNFSETAARAGNTALIFSLEMPGEGIASRLMAGRAGISVAKLKRPKQLENSEFPKLVAACSDLADLPIVVDESSSLSMAEIAAKARSVRRQNGLGLVVIDYLQLVKPSKAETRSIAVGLITKSAKRLAKELNVPVVLLAQLNRSIEARADKTPLLSDLRESGEIEQDADLVMFVHRDDFYNPNSELAGIGELKIAKHRNGETGTVYMRWTGEATSYGNLPREEWPQGETSNQYAALSGLRGSKFSHRGAN